jgi:alpha-ribazole phosphatase
MTRLVFVRHGKALGAEHRCIGHTDLALSPDGAIAIRELAMSTQSRDMRIVSSDLCRAVESANVIADAFDCAVDTDPRLREMNFGRWDGRRWADIERDDADRLQAWMRRWTDVAPPDGESAADLATRATNWLTETLAAAPPDDRIIVVSHAGWIRAALTHLFRRDLARMFEIPVEHARATIVEASASGCVLLAANSSTLEPAES